MIKKYRMLGLSIITLLIDQIIKFIVVNKMTYLQTIEVIKNFFNITYIKNDGAAFNILSGNKILIILLTVIVVYLFYLLFIRNNKLSLYNEITYGILLGGIFGNFLDRLIYGSVIDYLDFKILGFNYPVFNFADSLIVISIFLILIDVIRGEDNANNSKRRGQE